jgi:predicted permease
LTRQLLTESLVLAFAGGVVGIGLARYAIPIIVHLSPADIPRVDEVGFNVPLLIYALTLSSCVGAAVGLIPALRVTRSDHIGAMTAANASEKKSRLGFGGVGSRELVIVGEMAMAMVLLVGAGLLIRSFISLVTVNPGYDARNVLTFQVVLPTGRVSDPRDFYEEVMARLDSVPAVQAVGSTDVLPIAGSSAFHYTVGGLPIPPSPGDSMVMRIVSRDYFRAMGIRVLEGRSFLAGDGEGQHQVMVVNREFARRYFGVMDPVGKIVGQAPVTYEVVGVVDDVREEGLAADVRPEYYVELRQFVLGPIPRPYFVIRSVATPIELAAMIRSVVRQIDPLAGVDLNIATMADIVSASVARPRFYALLLGTFAGVALVLAAVGIYGVMAYSVAQRTREIGIRAALGARGVDLVALFLRRSVAMTAVGIVLGLAGAAAVTRSLEGMLFGLTPLDRSTFVLVSLVFAIVATMASYIPARRATKVDPLVALRCE